MDCTPLAYDFNASIKLSTSPLTVVTVTWVPHVTLVTYEHVREQEEDEAEESVHALYEWLEAVIYARVIVPICVFGILGNILNLVVLTRKGLQRTMDRMERSAHTGLTALAVSDLLFCLLLLPNAWVDWGRFVYAHLGFDIFYKVYSEALISMFIMSSTWLTVAMATSRYLAICHPLKARQIIGMTFARWSIGVVFIFCIFFNLPRFWRQSVDHLVCQEGITVYFTSKGFLQREQVFGTVYMWVYFMIGIVGPLMVLAYCNAHLIQALRRSTAMRRQHHGGLARVDSTHRITLTLAIIVIMYITLVSPAEIINFLQKAAIADASLTQAHNLAVAIVNCLQAVNFAFNFVLYCAINVHFRRTVSELFTCRRNHHRDVTTYQSISMTTTVTSSGGYKNINSATHV